MSTFEEQAARFRHYNELKVRSHILDLYHDDREVQVCAANQLCDYNYPLLAVRPLIDQLNSKQSDVRLYARLILTRLGPFSLAPLIDALQNEDKSSIRCGIIKVLGNIGSLYATTFVTSALNDTDAMVRQAAAYALMTIEDEETTPILCQALRNSDNYVRCCAAIALGNINTEDVKLALNEACQDSDQQVRKYIEEALLNHKTINRERLHNFKMWYVRERKRRQVEHYKGRLRQKDQDSRRDARYDLSQKTSACHTMPDSSASQAHQDKAIDAASIVEQPATNSAGTNIASQQATLYENTFYRAEPPKEKADKSSEIAHHAWDELWNYRVEIMLENIAERRGDVLLAIEFVGGHPRAKMSLLKLLECDNDILREAAADALLSGGEKEDVVEKRLQRYERRNTPNEPDGYKFKPSPKTPTAAAPPKKTPARSGYAIPVPPPPPAPKPFALDMNSVQQKIVETTQVQELLRAQFVEEEAEAAVVAAVAPAAVVMSDAKADGEENAPASNPFKRLDTPHFALLNMLMRKPFWKMQDIEAVAKPLGLLANGALERLNDMALDMGEECIFEGDDPIEVNIALIRELLL